MNKRCVFHLPYHLDEKAFRARMLRPRKMIQAFRDSGYDVFVISGFSHERKELIRKFKAEIEAGEKFSFIYSESSTMPTILTDPHHYPLHPFLDFGFFRFAKEKLNMKIGLFLCDIYWKFKSYGKDLPFWKKFFAIQCYNNDIRQYEKLLDKFYMPGIEGMKYVNSGKLQNIFAELPPGCDDIIVPERDYSKRDFRKDPLKLFYVGGISKEIYVFTELARAVNITDNCELTICCRPDEWESVKDDYKHYLNNKIKIVHKGANELEQFYSEADLCSLVFYNSNDDGGIYRKMARSVKSFEYLAHEVPVICTEGFAASDFVIANNTGWSMEYNAEKISSVLKHIMANPEELTEKRKSCHAAKVKNLWKCRAEKVIADLTQ